MVAIEDAARQRVRSLRLARGWSLDELGRRTHLSPSTISRIETGHRRLALDQLVVLARALEVSIDELVADAAADDVVIRPERNDSHGWVQWMLNRPDDPSGRAVAKMRMGPLAPDQVAQVHPGREWFYVLEGTALLVLGGRELLVRTGEAAEFDTMTPHAFGGYRGEVEIVTIFDRHGERAHLNASTATPASA